MGTSYMPVTWCALCNGHHPEGQHWVRTRFDAVIQDCEDCGLPVNLCECHDIPEPETTEVKFDKMVRAASAPNLATLIKEGLASGILHHEHNYQQYVNNTHYKSA